MTQADWRYPPGTVAALIDSALVTPATRAAMLARLAPGPVADDLGLAMPTLRAVCDRLIPQAADGQPIDIAAGIVAQLATGVGDGWRYADLPDDRTMWRLGLAAIDAMAARSFGAAFAALSAGDRDRLLQAIQDGGASGPEWQGLPAARVFEEMLAAAVAVYYAHPVAQSEIGYAGMADAAGWHAIGLDEREAHEPIGMPNEPGH